MSNFTVNGAVRVRLVRPAIALAIIAFAGLSFSPVASPGHAAPANSTSSLSSSTTTSEFGETVDFFATVGGTSGGAPTGTVTFKDGATTLGSGILNTLGAGATIAVGFNHSCALTATGGVKCWGDNDHSQLGDNNSPVASAVPIDVFGLTSGVTAIAAGGYHTCALLTGGGVKCWGDNDYGQLGNNATIDRQFPVDVVGLTSGVVAITAGGYHTCALTEAGGAKCWGFNTQGQIGDGTTDEHHTPVDVSGLTNGVSAIEGGNNHTCAITDAGGLKCWGLNTYGRLGDGTTDQRETPVDVVGLASGVASVSAGLGTCVVTAAGGAKCWGDNANGQVGDGTTDERHIPTDVGTLSSGVAAVRAGFLHNCALTTSGGVKCWGGNLKGELGDGSAPAKSLTPVNVTGLSSGVHVLATFAQHTCAQIADGGAKCWGYNNKGQLGDTNGPTDADEPVGVVSLGAGTTLIFGTTAMSTAALTPGSRAVTANYSGDANHNPSTSPALTQIVNKGTTEAAIKVKPKKPKEGKSARIKVTITGVAPAFGTPEGKLIVKDGKKKLGKFKLKKGNAKIRMRNLKRGKHKIKAIYKGDASWEGSKAKAKFRVR